MEEHYDAPDEVADTRQYMKVLKVIKLKSSCLQIINCIFIFLCLAMSTAALAIIILDNKSSSKPSKGKFV